MKYYTFTNIFSKEYNRKLLEKCKPLLMDGETLDGFYGRGSTPAKQSHPTLHLNPNFDDFHNQILKRIKEESGLDLKLERSWVNGTHGKKKDMLWHSHEAFGTDYAGVYYVKTPLPFFSNGTLFEDRFIKVPQNGLLIFPSNIPHTAPSSPFRMERYTIAMDFIQNG